ncbi:MAG: cyclic nucleotide-binding domain-containing protein [Gammaproteobacteria bacterium]|nr:cyclic nucleotide-binding domain-containing protein [Gammaproteobacteria bacterium]
MASYEKLAANRLFRGLPEGALQSLHDKGETIAVGAGNVLISEGQNNTQMYFVLDGELEVRLEENPERFSELQLGTRGPGSCVGEYSFIDRKPASATVIATKPSEVFRISHETLERLLESSHALGSTVYRNLLLHLVDRLRATNAELDLFGPF